MVATQEVLAEILGVRQPLALAQEYCWANSTAALASLKLGTNLEQKVRSEEDGDIL